MKELSAESESAMPKILFWLVPLALAAAVGLFNIDCNFMQDDEPAIQINPIVVHNLSCFEVFQRDFWGAPINGRVYAWRPLLPIIWKWVWAIGGGSVLPFRIITLLLHMTVTLLLLLLGSKLAINRAILWMTAILFAVHAVHAEALGSVVSQADILSTVLGLLAIWLALDARGILRGILAGLLLALACLAKESAFTFGVALMILPWTQTGRSNKERLCVALPAFVVTCGIVAFQIMVGRAPVDPVNNIAYSVSANGILRFLYGFYMIGRATSLSFVPLGLSPSHDYAAVDLSLTCLLPHAIPGLIILAAGLGTFYWALKSHSTTWIIGLCFFFVPVLLLSSLIIPVQAVLPERLLYLSSVTACVMMAALLYYGISSPSRWVIFALLISFMLVQSWSVQRTWRSQITLYSYTVKAESLSWRAHQNYAGALHNARLYPEAIWEFMVTAYILSNFPKPVDIAPVMKAEEIPLDRRLVEGPVLLANGDLCRFFRLFFRLIHDHVPKSSPRLLPFYREHYPDCFDRIEDTKN